jgi:TIR domain
MPEVFISHITEEAPVADALKVYLKRCFGQAFSVFVSSDYDSIGTGVEWYRAIVDGVLGARAVIVLLSKYSEDRRWINFEAGVAVGAKRRVLPVTIRSFPPGQVPFPLAGLHIRVLADELAIESLVGAIADAVAQEQGTEDTSGFVERLRSIEGTLPVKGISLEPLLQHQPDSSLALRFRLSNTGNRDVELIEIEACIPKFIVDPNWQQPANIPNALYIERLRVEHVDYVRFFESPPLGAMDFKGGNIRYLPRIISPHWTPRPSDLIRVPVRQDIEEADRWHIKFKVVARDVYSEEQSVSLAAIPALE